MRGTSKRAEAALAGGNMPRTVNHNRESSRRLPLLQVFEPRWFGCTSSADLGSRTRHFL